MGSCGISAELQVHEIVPVPVRGQARHRSVADPLELSRGDRLDGEAARLREGILPGGKSIPRILNARTVVGAYAPRQRLVLTQSCQIGKANVGVIPADRIGVVVVCELDKTT